MVFSKILTGYCEPKMTTTSNNEVGKICFATLCRVGRSFSDVAVTSKSHKTSKYLLFTDHMFK